MTSARSDAPPAPRGPQTDAERYAEVLDRAVQAAVGGHILKITTHTAEEIARVLRAPASETEPKFVVCSDKGVVQNIQYEGVIYVPERIATTPNTDYRDAARYRWLRDGAEWLGFQWRETHPMHPPHLRERSFNNKSSPHMIDSAIDEALERTDQRNAP